MVTEILLAAIAIGALESVYSGIVVRLIPKKEKKISREDRQAKVLRCVKAYQVYRHDNDFDEAELVELEYLIDNGYIAVKRKSKELYLTETGNLKLELSL